MTTVEFINFLEYRYSNSSFDDYYYSQYGEMRVTYALLTEFNKLRILEDFWDGTDFWEGT